MRTVSSILFFLGFLAGIMSARLASAGDLTLYRIQNCWQPKEFLYDSAGEVKYGPASDDTSLWSVEKNAGFQCIRNKGTGKYLALAKGADSVITAAAAGSEDPAARWAVELVSEHWKSIRSLENHRYMNIERQTGGPTVDMANAPTGTNFISALWDLAYVSGPPPAPEYKNGMVFVTSPEYYSTIRGDTPVSVVAPGFADAVARCWKQGGPFGSDSVVAQVPLDADGKGSFTFPADQYPHGPITVRITGGEGKAADTCILMVYNAGGVVWNEGIPAAVPEAAKGMKVVYADDFDKPLSISHDGKNATYASHKPGGGDFGHLPFSDFQSDRNPFLQVDSYLRIRADANRKFAGLISSLRYDGTGFTAKLPCYFECRFIAQSAPGTWPAWWLMTQGSYRGLKTPADEYDIIEGYGGTGPHNPNQTGYWTTTHFWNQPPPKQPGVWHQFPMTTIGGHSSWWETFHTYGLKVTATDTIYYCDNVETARHPTSRLTKAEPLFFMIDLAVPGKGWPSDLSQYNGVADMYVDWVRVFQGE